ncbi:unnamed protein product [Orchesella dallaii]|uniref:Uncharacterized protein n=1 Tax=Orchesella dallaii TaxID=48710 RepID=A0ABP1PKU1_9HEXA
MQYINSHEMGQSEISSRHLAFFNHCPISDFLNCIRNSCDTIQCNQLSILQFFKTNLVQLKTEVDSCLNKLIGQELQIQYQTQCSEKPEQNPTVQDSNNEPNEKRQKNIVIHGLDDPDLIKSDRKYDIISNFFQSAMNLQINVEAIQVVKARKPGTFVTIVTLNSKQEKQIVFRNCHLLKTYHKKISITDDLLPSEKKTLPIKRKHQESISNANTITEEDLIALKEVLYSGTNKRDNNPPPDNSIQNFDTQRRHDFHVDEKDDSYDRNLKQEITNNSSSSFLSSREVVSKLEELRKIGYSQHHQQAIVDKHANYTRQFYEKSICICENFCNLPWHEFENELELKITKKMKKQYKTIIKYVQNLWNADDNHNETECFCKHVLSH